MMSPLSAGMLVVLVLFATGCESRTTPRQERAEPPGAQPADETLPIPRSVLTAICNSEPCGGDAASVEVYRDAAGTVRRLFRLYGSCTHSPGIYFDPSGRQTELIPERPVMVGSPEQAALAARHEAQIGGLTRAEVIRCSDGLILPRRPTGP